MQKPLLSYNYQNQQSSRVYRLAFVEVKTGVEGLVHISEMAHKHVETPHEVVAKDEEIDVKVLSISPEEERISLSIKALEDAP